MGTIQNTAALYLRKSAMDDQLFVSGHTITAWARHRTRPRRSRDSDPDSPSCSSAPSPLSGSSGISTPWVGLPWHSSSSSLRWNTPALRRRPRPLSDVRRGTRCGRDPLWATPQDLTRRPWLGYYERCQDVTQRPSPVQRYWSVQTFIAGCHGAVGARLASR